MDTANLHFNNTIKNWDEAVPLGNGQLGCLIWDSSDKLRFTLDRSDLWDCSNTPENQKNFSYADIINSVKKKKKGNLYKKYDACYFRPTPTKLPAGKIILDLGVRENVESDLSFQRAEAVLKIGDITVKSFIHANESYGLIYVSKENIGIEIKNPKFGGKRKSPFESLFTGTVQSLKNIHYPAAKFSTENENGIKYQYFIQKTNDRYYGIVAGIKEYDGETLIAYTVAMDRNKYFISGAKKILEGALNKGYENALKEHLIWWNDYWRKSKISIPDKFIEKQWNFNNYLLASCSRKGNYPMPLQGLWTADNDSLPPWKGDYHHDLNTQMSYTSYLKANHTDEGECFIDYLLDLSEEASKFARTFYNADGLCLPSVMDIEGHALGGWCQYSLSPTNQLWLCCIMARHFYFTRDINLLKERIYPYMVQTGKFLFSILKKENGKYKLPLSTSPEIHDNTLKAFLTPNSNYDLSLMRAFSKDMTNLSCELGYDAESELWANRLNDFDELAVNNDNVLMLCSDESPYESHRHHSHCMSIYPLRTMKYDNQRNKEIIDATVKNLEKFGMNGWVGYSLGWMAQFYIIKGDGDKAFEMINTFYRYYCTDNGFHSNGDYRGITGTPQKCRLFTLEGNFLATDAVQEMLLYSEDDGIEVFPAIPDNWNDACFDGFLAYGGVQIGAKLENREITQIKLYATADTSVKFKKNDKYRYAFDLPETVQLKKGEAITFSK